MHTGPPKAPLTRPYTHTEASGSAAKGPKQNAQTYRLSSSMCDITRPLLLSSIVSKCARRCAARAHVLKHLDRNISIEGRICIRSPLLSPHGLHCAVAVTQSHKHSPLTIFPVCACFVRARCYVCRPGAQSKLALAYSFTAIAP